MCFFWLFFHNLLPTQSRLHRILRTVDDPSCVHCDSGDNDHAWNHTFTSCEHTASIMDWLLTKLNTLPIDNVNIETALWLQFPPPITDSDLLCAIWLVGEALAYTWARRKNREDISSATLHAILSYKAYHTVSI